MFLLCQPLQLLQGLMILHKALWHFHFNRAQAQDNFIQIKTGKEGIAKKENGLIDNFQFGKIFKLRFTGSL